MEPTPAPASAPRLLLQVGAIAVVFAASPTRAFDLDRFLVPKELALHLTAVLAGLFALRTVRRSGASGIDLALAAYLVLSLVSACLAPNAWLAARAVALTASALVLYWAARGLRAAGEEGPLLDGVALAVVLAAATSLLQAYGVELAIFSANRAPGGTLGNRNFVAHAAAFGLPLVIVAGLRAARGRGVLFWSSGLLLLVAVLVLTRSRAAWLAATAAAVLIGSALALDAVRREGTAWRRFTTLAIFAAGGALAALAIPNTLRWRSENPYLDSVQDIANYEEGSGRGRLIQYGRTLRMAAAHPVLGVGPGNWPVVYPAFAAPRDPSMDTAAGGVTHNPWPSSDWVAFVSERGIPAAGLLVLAIGGIAMANAKRVWSAQTSGEALEAAALLATLAAAVVAGLFDAVLLLALPAQLVWTATGALDAPDAGHGAADARSFVFVAALVISAVGAARSAAQITAMEIYARTGDRAALTVASRIDPGNYRLHLRIGGREHGCAAAALFPHASGGERNCR
jgi:O-antigen ligase/polysaccharide polymerase Wzy-like membrane protein